MKKNSTAMPLSVKMPLFAAAFIAAVVLSVISFEALQDNSDIHYGSCKIIHQDRVYGGQHPVSFLASVYRGVDSFYRAVGLQRSHRDWALYKMKIASDFNINFELLKYTPNDLENIKAEDYSVGAFNNRQAIIGTQESGFFAIKFDDQNVAPQNKINLCGSKWPVDVRFSFLNSIDLMAYLPDGRLSLFNTDSFGLLVPRGVGKNPDSLFTVQANNSLEYSTCQNFKSSKSARLSAAAGRFAFSSGGNGRIAVYDVNNTGLSLKGREVDGVSGFSDLYVSRKHLLVKNKSWLERDADWKLLPESGNAYNEKLNSFKRPIRDLDDYETLAGKASAEWILQTSGRLYRKTYLSKISDSGDITHYALTENIFSVEPNNQDPWIALPGNRHLIFRNGDKRVDYVVLACE